MDNQDFDFSEDVPEPSPNQGGLPLGMPPGSGMPPGMPGLPPGLPPQVAMLLAGLLGASGGATMGFTPASPETFEAEIRERTKDLPEDKKKVVEEILRIRPSTLKGYLNVRRYDGERFKGHSEPLVQTKEEILAKAYTMAAGARKQTKIIEEEGAQWHVLYCPCEKCRSRHPEGYGLALSFTDDALYEIKKPGEDDEE